MNKLHSEIKLPIDMPGCYPQFSVGNDATINVQ
jgi:hypothetical protein